MPFVKGLPYAIDSGLIQKLHTIGTQDETGGSESESDDKPLGWSLQEVIETVDAEELMEQ